MTHRILLVLAVVLAVPCAAGAEDANAARRPIWLAVTRQGLASAVKPLAQRRQAQGFEAVISTEPVDRAVAGLKRKPAMILLVGDDRKGKASEGSNVPARRIKFYGWQGGQKEQFASDMAWGDLSGDSIADVPVGRLPARTPDDVKRLVDKIIRYEEQPPTLDDLTLPFWAGEARYGDASEWIASRGLLPYVRGSAPLWASPWIICGNTESMFCGWPPDEPALFERQIAKGGLLAVMIGHGDVGEFCSMDFLPDRIGYYVRHAQKLRGDRVAPPTVIIACYCGDFTDDKPCLAEAMVQAEGGPVAVVASTGESHPLTNFFTTQCLLQQLSGEQRLLGPLWMAVQQAARTARNPLAETLLRSVEGDHGERLELSELRTNQALMYAILGDPATRLHLPDRLHGKIVRDGDAWRWTIQKPAEAVNLRVEFRPTAGSPPPREGTLEQARATKEFHRANDSLGFDLLKELSAKDKWEGTVGREGVVRFVAAGGGKIYVAASEVTAR